MSITNLLAAYLTPWLRVGRGTFNLVFFVAMLPGLLLGFTSAASFIAPLLSMFEAGQHLATTAQGPATALNGALTAMHGAGQGFQQASQPGSAWADWLDPLIMLALIPLIAARTRDCGQTPTTVKTLTGLAIAGTALGIFKLLGLPTFGLTLPAGLAGFVVITYLCTRKSAPRPKPYIQKTNPTNPASIPPDDDDYPNPFARYRVLPHSQRPPRPAGCHNRSHPQPARRHLHHGRWHHCHRQRHFGERARPPLPA